MKCEQAIKWIDDCLDSELLPDCCDHLQEHLAHCQGCSSTLHSFQSLKNQAASLPRAITPQRDLWPDIAGRLIVAEFPKRLPDLKSNVRKPTWRRAVRYWPWIAAAALCCTLLLFLSPHFASRQQSGETAKVSGGRQIGNVLPDQPKQETATVLPNVSQQQRAKAETGLNPQSWEYVPDYRAYLLDSRTRVFVSNSGAYAVHSQYDSSNRPGSGQILRFEPDGTVSSWEPALPPDAGSAYSVYPGSGGCLWLSCQADDRSTAFFESSFGDARPPKELGRMSESFINQFAVGPQGIIYALGARYDLSSLQMNRAQSIFPDIIHVLDSRSGRLNHLMPLIIQPDFESPNLQVDLFSRRLAAPSGFRISLLPNGNFILSILPEKPNWPGTKELVGKEAVEYSQAGQVVRRWDLGISAPDAHVGNIFVDTDNSLIAEVKYPDAAAKPDLKSAPAHRYFLHINPAGTLSRYDELIPADETVVGWIGETREMVTQIRRKEEKVEIRFRRLSIN